MVSCITAPYSQWSVIWNEWGASWFVIVILLLTKIAGLSYYVKFVSGKGNTSSKPNSRLRKFNLTSVGWVTWHCWDLTQIPKPFVALCQQYERQMMLIATQVEITNRLQKDKWALSATFFSCAVSSFRLCGVEWQSAEIAGKRPKANKTFLFFSCSLTLAPP